MHYEGLPPQLFDLRDDPLEVGDRGLDPLLAGVREERATMLFDWIRSRQIHPTVSAQSMADWTDKAFRIGIHMGTW